MSSSKTDNTVIPSLDKQRLNPAELKIDLLCCGMRIDGNCRIEEEARPMGGTTADLASGLEIILPGETKEFWVNVPVREKFARNSPYLLRFENGRYHLGQEQRDLAYEVRLAPKPAWYNLCTAQGIPMLQVGMLQGTVLIINLGEQCRLYGRGSRAAATPEKTVADVMEIARMAQRHSGTTLVLLRGGYQGTGSLSRLFPFIEALKQEVGILVGVQFPPEIELRLYDQACAIGVDHFSFAIDLFNEDYLSRYAPAGARMAGLERYMRAVEHCTRALGKGRVAGEIIAGVEPIEDSLRAIDYLVNVGALPLVSIFRPLEGTELENLPPPRSQEMLAVFRHVYDACRSRNLPLGVTPNIHLSVLPHPVETLYLAPDSSEGRAYERWISTMKQMMRPYFMRRMRKYGASPSNSNN